MLCTDVTPCSLTYFIAAGSARSFISEEGAGTTASTRPIALSLRTPVGSPLRSRTIAPPGISLVARVMPASFSAALFASDMWPSSRLIHTG